jgi:hypothetical protein
MRYISIFLFVFLFFQVHSQPIVGLSTKWDDSFTEWLIVTEDEDLTGEITLRWPQREDWSEWDIRLGEMSGSIKAKWKDDPNVWELRADNEIVTIRTIWTGDFRQWEIKGSTCAFDIKSKWSNIFEEWESDKSKKGQLKIYTAWEGDLRDWVLEDGLNEAVSTPCKIAMIFVPVLYATPKF